ncbi:MAG: GGDEF domain-containing protein [Clostridia bacterium]|nr:GGDEF domain-containing protein [Clostridia bacterium]
MVILMKKHILLLSNLIIILFIVIGYIVIVYKDARDYQILAEKHLESTLSLADIDISNHIESSMTKPIMVSKTMANDEFLKEWLSKEPESIEDDGYLGQLYNYLKTYCEKYGYTTVFCVSEKTGNYYYQDGLNKVVSETDEHDIWFYNFKKSGHEYDLQVDTNETNGNTVTVFVNFRVEKTDGSLLGVIGVGLEVDTIEETIRNYESNYGLSVFIINEGGSDNSFTGDTNLFINHNELADRMEISENIELNKSYDPLMQWFSSGANRKCLISKYDETLGWYLILEMDTESISRSFSERIMNNILYMLLSLTACIIVTTFVFYNYNKRVITIENTDELTGLVNRKLFYNQYHSFLRKHHRQDKTLFMLDIDHFKSINDTRGHLFGNAVLAMVGDELKKMTEEYGIAARWGGDEFLGILSVGKEEATQILGNLMGSLKSDKKDESYRITVSVGITEIAGKHNLEQLIKKADEALYLSKKNGRDRISFQ